MANLTQIKKELEDIKKRLQAIEAVLNIGGVHTEDSSNPPPPPPPPPR